MDGHCSSPEPHFESPPQNTSTPARKGCSDGGSGSEESVRDEEEEEEHTEDDLDEFFKNAEGLSDQTFGDMRHSICSLSTDMDKSLSHSYHHTLNEGSMTNPNLSHLSCSLLVDAEKSLQCWKQKSNEIAYQLGTTSLPEYDTATDPNELVKILHNELIKAYQENKTLKIRNETLSEIKEKQEEFIKQASGITSKCIPKIRSARENIEISVCSLEHDFSPNTTADGFHLSSYVKQLDRNIDTSEILQENRSSQTTPSRVPHDSDEDVHDSKFNSIFEYIDAYKREWFSLKQTTQQELSGASKELKNFTIIVQQMISCYKNELSTSKQKQLEDQKHYQEVINNLKDEIKTMKMRSQELKKHKDQEIRELKSRLPETNDNNENVAEGNLNLVANTAENHAAFDDSFSSCNSNIEETFTNLTRTNPEYLKLTPSEYVDDEVIDTFLIPDGIRHLLDDKDLKFKDLEKKFEANKRYLEDMTHEREIEREEFQQQSEEHLIQIEELKKENGKYTEEKKQLVYQIEELTTRLQNAEENEMEIAQKWEKSDGELKSAVEKIFELREIVRDQEARMDEMTQNVAQLEEQKQILRDELEKQELLSKKEQPIYKEQDAYGTLPLDVTDEIHQQLQELARRIEYKVTEMDSVQVRPGSSCSGVTSAVSTEDISCREVAGRTSRNLESCSYEHMGSAIFNEIHRLESHVENLIRYDDIFIKKLKDAELQTAGQKNKIEELENQISIYQEKCSKQMLTIADLEGKIDALRFESSNQGLISSLQARLATASKQLDELRILLASKDKELTQVRAEFNMLRTKQLERETEKKEASVQTCPVFEDTISYNNLTYEGVSPEKIRRMDTVNQLNASVISLSRTLGKDSQGISFEPEISILESFHEPGRSGKGVAFAGGDSCAANESSTGEVTIKEMDDSLLQLQHLLNEKDKEIQNLHKRLSEAEQRRDCFENRVDNSKTSNKCEQESIVLETDLNPGQQGTTQRGVLQGRGPGSSGDSSMYEISYSHDYEVDGDLLKYLGTKLLYQGPKNENIGDQGERRVLETDRQIEIATLNTHILQLKRALDDEKKKSEDLLKRLKVCEEDKAALRARSPMSRAPVQNIVSSVSVHQMQQRELARQVEDGRKMLKEKEKEIRSLKNKITDYEAKLSDKDNHEQELAIRLNNTIAMLKRCEEHGRELTASNKEQVHEIRRLRTQLDRANVNRNSENCPPTGSGSEYFENYMRAKSHRKALAWQKKYLSSVILGYKSILRQNGHGSEHPDLLQTQIPIAPGAVGYLDTQSPRTRFRIGVLSVIATLRMKYMVSRWNKKRPGETSPDSEYKMSRHSTRVDTNIIRPRRTTLMHSSRVNSAHTPSPIDNNVNTQEARRGNLGDISEYLSRFATLENEISSSLSRNVRPNRPK